MTAGERGEHVGGVLGGRGEHERARRSNRAGTGSASVTVHGAGLGLVAFTALGRVGQTGCEGTEWESETSVRCLVGQGSGDSAGGDDGGERGRHAEAMLCGRGEHERDAEVEPGRDGVGVGDGARVGSGAGGVHGAGAGGADGMRGDGVGVGDVGAVPGGAWDRGTRRVAMTAGERAGACRRVTLWTRGAERVPEVNRAGTGSASVTVHGSRLGLVAFTALGRVGQTGCEGTEWESETSVRCLVGHGLRGRGGW